MSTPRKHSLIIKAWADGAEIQYWDPYIERWVDIAHPSFLHETEYRIKPQDVSDVIRYAKVGVSDCGKYFHIEGLWKINSYDDKQMVSDTDQTYDVVGQIMLVFDGETKILKRVEVV